MKETKFFRITGNPFIDPCDFLYGSCNVLDIGMGWGLGDKFSFLAKSKNFSHIKRNSCLNLAIILVTDMGLGPWREIFVFGI